MIEEITHKKHFSTKKEREPHRRILIFVTNFLRKKYIIHFISHKYNKIKDLLSPLSPDFDMFIPPPSQRQQKTISTRIARGIIFASMRENFLLFIIVVIDVEVTELVRGLVGGDHTQVITELIFLQVLLGQVLQVTLGERHLGGHADSGLLLLGFHVNPLAQVTGLVVNFDLLQQIFLEGRGVQQLSSTGALQSM